MLPRRFALFRHVDYTGVSGIGVVAYGVAFTDGHVVLRWTSANPSTSMWNSIDDVLAVHGHGEGTSIEWIDTPHGETEELSITSSAGRRARRRATRQAAEADAEAPASNETAPSDSDESPASDVRTPPHGNVTALRHTSALRDSAEPDVEVAPDGETSDPPTGANLRPALATESLPPTSASEQATSDTEVDDEDAASAQPATEEFGPFFTNPHKSNGHPHVDTITGLLEIPDDLRRRAPEPPESDSSMQRGGSRRPGRHRREDDD